MEDLNRSEKVKYHNLQRKVVYLLFIFIFIMFQQVTLAQENEVAPTSDNNNPQNVASPDKSVSESPKESTENLVKEDQSTVDITGFTFNNSSILTKEELESITKNYIGKISSIEDLKNVINDINALYAKKGYITARAFLPPQTVNNGLIEIKLVEGHIGEITVEGNKHTRKNYILGKISQKPGDLFKLQALEQNILKFNRNNDVKLRANLKPGAEFGTTDIQLVANDPFPFHLVPTFDNTGRDTVGILRGGVAVAADSLLGYRDQLTMGYSRAKSTDVAYGSYSFPISNYGTRIGTTFAFSQIKISSGPFKDFNIGGNSFNYNGYISQQIISTPRFDLSADFGFDSKKTSTFWDNITLFRTCVRDISLGINFQERDKTGRWMTRSAFTQGFDLLHGTAPFFKYEGNLTRIQNLGHGIIAIFRSAAQLTPDRLLPIEQFQLGGSGTVRGYSEGFLIGDNGYFTSLEFRLPLPFLPKKIGKLTVRERIQGVVFVDHGGVFIHHAIGGDGAIRSANHQNYLTSVGLGLRGSITKYISGRADWGFGLDHREHPQPVGRLHFGLQANPF